MKKFTSSILFLTFCALANAQVIDTVFSDNKQNGVWVKNGIDIQTLNTDCSVATNLFKAWDAATASYVNTALTTFSYDTAGNNTGLVSQVWDASSATWINTGRTFYTYSSDGRYFTNLSQNWDIVTLQWVNNFRILVEFNADGTTKASEFSLYDANQGWLKQARNLNTYDDQKRLTDFLYQAYVNGAWLNNSRTSYDYSKGGLSISYAWDAFNAAWIKVGRGFNDYLPGTSIPIRQLYQSYTGLSWLNQSRTSTDYNASNNVERAKGEFWDIAKAQWFNGYRVNGGYYPDGSQQYFRFEGWDILTNTWSYGYRAVYTNNACATTVDFTAAIETLTDRTGENFIKKLLSGQDKMSKAFITEKSFASGNRQLSFTLRRTLKAKSKPVRSLTQSNNVVADNKVLIAPNPAKGYFTMNLSSYKAHGSVTLTITDLSGKKVVQKQLPAGSVQQVAIPNVAKGMYVVNVIAGQYVHTQKLIVE